MTAAQAATLTALFRQQTLRQRRATLKSLLALWPTLDATALDESFDAWSTAVLAVIERDAAIHGGLALAYVRAFRAAVGVVGAMPSIQAPVVDTEQALTALRVTSVVSVKANMGRLVPLQRAMANAFVASSGAATRLTLDAGRQTVQRAVLADPRAAGWRRVTSSGACDFCEMLASRGDVYREETAQFRSHDHCACSAEPVYR